MKFLEHNPHFIEIVKKILNNYLSIQANENFLICCDYPNAQDFVDKDKAVIEKMLKRLIITKNIFATAKEILPDTKIDLLLIPCQWQHYVELSPDIEQKISSSDVLYALTEFSISPAILRIGRENPKLRAALSPYIDESMFDFDGVLDISDTKFESEILRVYEILKSAKQSKIYSELGTDLTIDFIGTDVNYETMRINEPGTIKNLPAGDVSFDKATINGEYFTPRGWLEGLKGDLVLTVKDSNIIDILYKDPMTVNQDIHILSDDETIPINHVSIGMNEKAKNPFFLLEQVKMRGVVNIATFQQPNEKLLAICSSFNGNFPTPNITLEVDGKTIIHKSVLKL